MNYLAGIFDAEGHVSLSLQGGQIVSLEMCNEEIVNLFHSTFGGSISDYKRENRKKIYSWRCLAPNIPYFIEQIEPHSFLKKQQLLLLKSYIDQTREDRRNSRSEYVSKIAACKRPPLETIDLIKIPSDFQPTQQFFEWFAGFLDGDGNFCCYEYTSSKFNSGRVRFASTVSCFNVMPDLIRHIKKHIDGSISVLKQNKNPVWKWVCSRQNTIYLCESVLPYIKIKKVCCQLLIEFVKIFNTKCQRIPGKGSGKGNWQTFSFEEIDRMREIIQQIKHQNSL